MKEGYYWVNSESEWSIAYYSELGWCFCGNEIYYEDAEFDDVRPVEIPDFVKKDEDVED